MTDDRRADFGNCSVVGGRVVDCKVDNVHNRQWNIVVGNSMTPYFSLDDWAKVSTIAGALVAIVALIYTAHQIHQNTQISRGQFWLELEKMFSQHDEVHLNLRPGGKWSGGETGPEDSVEWAKVEDYMGLFEHCEIMLQRKLIDEETFKAIFSYRLRNILSNEQICRAKLVDEKASWENFLKLLKRLKIPFKLV